MMLSAYRQRLSSSFLRRKYHQVRYLELQRFSFHKYDVLEIGCHDGLSLEFMKPRRYFGYDVGWEDGIETIQPKPIDHHHCTFMKTGSFDEAIQASFEPTLLLALETIEHLPEEELAAIFTYIQSKNVNFLFSVPNEIGLIFVLKSIYKKIFQKEKLGFTAYEFLFQALGCTSRVIRDNHKGFNYRVLYQKISKLTNKKVKIYGAPIRTPIFSPTIFITNL